MRPPRWTRTLLAAALFLPAEALAKPLDVVSGPMRCGINGYGWPHSADTMPLATDVGTLEIVSDGNGNYTSGQMTENLADDTHTFGTNVCTFDLVTGTYQQNADGSTANTMIWKLRPGSDSHCGAIATRAANLGFIEGARDFRPFQRTSTSYVLDDGRMVWVAASPQGVAIGACEPVKK